MRRAKHDRCGTAGMVGLEPARGAHAPTVSRLQASKAPLGPWSGKVVTRGLAEGEGAFGHHGADGVAADVVRSGRAAPRPGRNRSPGRSSTAATRRRPRSRPDLGSSTESLPPTRAPILPLETTSDLLSPTRWVSRHTTRSFCSRSSARSAGLLALAPLAAGPVPDPARARRARARLRPRHPPPRAAAGRRARRDPAAAPLLGGVLHLAPRPEAERPAAVAARGRARARRRRSPSRRSATSRSRGFRGRSASCSARSSRRPTPSRRPRSPRGSACRVGWSP